MKDCNKLLFTNETKPIDSIEPMGPLESIGAIEQNMPIEPIWPKPKEAI